MATSLWSPIGGVVTARGPGSAPCYVEIGLRALSHCVVRRGKEEKDTLEYSDVGCVLPGKNCYIWRIYII